MELKPFLNNQLEQNKSILFTGIGNVLRRDDGSGVYVCQKIQQSKNIEALNVETSIENYVGKINQINPDILILIDSTDFGQSPGYWAIQSMINVKDHTTNTHNISLRNVSELFNAHVFLLGIQPADVSFGEKITPCVKDALDELVRIINNRN